MTLAPQSASCRTAVGPARTRVRSRTVKRERACEARGADTDNVSDECFFLADRACRGWPDNPRSGKGWQPDHWEIEMPALFPSPLAGEGGEDEHSEVRAG